MKIFAVTILFPFTIKDTVDACHHTEPAFVAALVTVVVSSITHHTTLAPDTDTAVNPDKVGSGYRTGHGFRTGKVLWVFETFPFDNCDRCSVTPSLPYILNR